MDIVVVFFIKCYFSWFKDFKNNDYLNEFLVFFFFGDFYGII